MPILTLAKNIEHNLQHREKKKMQIMYVKKLFKPDTNSPAADFCNFYYKMELFSPRATK